MNRSKAALHRRPFQVLNLAFISWKSSIANLLLPRHLAFLRWSTQHPSLRQRHCAPLEEKIPVPEDLQFGRTAKHDRTSYWPLAAVRLLLSGCNQRVCRCNPDSDNSDSHTDLTRQPRKKRSAVPLDDAAPAQQVCSEFQLSVLQLPALDEPEISTTGLGHTMHRLVNTQSSLVNLCPTSVICPIRVRKSRLLRLLLHVDTVRNRESCSQATAGR